MISQAKASVKIGATENLDKKISKVVEDARSPLNKPIISQIPKFKSQVRTAERARAKLNLDPKYQKPASWAEFQLGQELKTQENGELFLQYDSGILISTTVMVKKGKSTVFEK